MRKVLGWICVVPGILVWSVLGWSTGAFYGCLWFLLIWVVFGFIDAWKRRTKGEVRP